MDKSGATRQDDRTAVVEEFYRARNQQDLDSLGRLLSDDCVRHFPRGHSVVAGDHRGKADVLRTFEHAFQVTGGNATIEVGEVMTNSDIVASYHREMAQRATDGLKMESDVVVRWKVEAGRIVEFWEYFLDVPAIDAFLSPATADPA